MGLSLVFLPHLFFKLVTRTTSWPHSMLPTKAHLYFSLVSPLQPSKALAILYSSARNPQIPSSIPVSAWAVDSGQLSNPGRETQSPSLLGHALEQTVISLTHGWLNTLFLWCRKGSPSGLTCWAWLCTEHKTGNWPLQCAETNLWLGCTVLFKSLKAGIPTETYSECLHVKTRWNYFPFPSQHCCAKKSVNSVYR